LDQATYPEASSGQPDFEISNFKFEDLKLLPYLVLHREEFAWPRMSPHAPVRSYSLKFEISNLKLAHLGRTVSPITCGSDLRSQNLSRAGWSILCCTCRRPVLLLSEISSLKSEI